MIRECFVLKFKLIRSWKHFFLVVTPICAISFVSCSVILSWLWLFVLGNLLATWSLDGGFSWSNLCEILAFFFVKWFLDGVFLKWILNGLTCHKEDIHFLNTGTVKDNHFPLNNGKGGMHLLAILQNSCMIWTKHSKPETFHSRRNQI